MPLQLDIAPIDDEGLATPELATPSPASVLKATSVKTLTNNGAASPAADSERAALSLAFTDNPLGAPEAERQLINVAMVDETGDTWPAILALPSEAWTDLSCRKTRDVIEAMEPPFDIDAAAKALGPRHMQNLIGFPLGSLAYFQRNVERVRSAWIRRRLKHVGMRITDAADCGNDDALADALKQVRDGAIPTHAGAANLCALWAPDEFSNHFMNTEDDLLGAGYVAKSEWTSFIGIGGLGKTRLALWFTICQLTGRDWCGLKTGGKPQKTLFLSTENGIPRWKVDIEKMFAGLTEAERATVEENLRILALTPDEDGDLNLGIPENVARLAATLKAENPGLVIFDPLADMIAGDENKTVDVITTLQTLRTVMRKNAPGSAVIIIHHARTGAQNVAQAGDNFSAGNFARGSKVLFSRVRCEIQLVPADRDDPNRLVLACGKSNNAVKFDTRGIVFDPETFRYEPDPDFDLQAWRDDVAGKRRETVVSIADVVEAVREVYQPGEDVATATIAGPIQEATGVTIRTIQRTLKAAEKAGYLLKGKKLGTWRLGSKPLKK